MFSFDLSQLTTNAAPRRNRTDTTRIAPAVPAVVRSSRADDGPLLPGVAQEIADVIGTGRALYLIGQLPRCLMGPVGRKSMQPMLYVPKRLTADHLLVRILGWDDAQALVEAFGGLCLKPPTCLEVYRVFRDQAIAGMLAEGLAAKLIADAVGVTPHRVRQIGQSCLSA